MQTAPYPRVGLIVTNMTRPAERVIRFYNQRGTAEPWIKEGKKAVTCPARAKTTDRTLTQAEAMQAIPTLRVWDRETPGDDFAGRVGPQIIHRTGDDQICRRMMKLHAINILSPFVNLKMLEWYSVDAIY